MCGHSEKNFCNEKKWFKFWPMMKNIFWNVQTNSSLVMACLQKYQEWLSLTTFHRVQLNSKVVTLLPMTKQVYLPEGYLSYQAKLFLVSWGHWELTPCGTFHIFLCCFNYLKNDKRFELDTLWCFPIFHGLLFCYKLLIIKITLKVK